MSDADITITSGDTVTFTEALSNGDEVDIVAYGTFSVASLNADNLDSGTVPSARVSGAYTGITSVGTLTSFTSTGIDDNASSTAMTLDSSGNLLVGKTSSDSGASAGFEFNPNGYAFCTRASAEPLIINRTTTDGRLIQFRKDGTQVGNIGNNGTELFIGTPSGSGGYIRLQSAGIVPATSTGANSDGTMQLGTATGRFSDLYLSGGAYLGGTGSANHLDDYEEGTFTPTLEDTGDSLNANLTAQIGQYTKIGNLCHIQIRINGNSRSATNNQVYVGGLPFTPSLSNTSNRAMFEVNGINLNLDAGFYSVIGQILHGDTSFNLLMQGTSLDNFRGHDLGSTYEIYVHGAYFTT